jgi:hypothetical protein
MRSEEEKGKQGEVGRVRDIVTYRHNAEGSTVRERVCFIVWLIFERIKGCGARFLEVKSIDQGRQLACCGQCCPSTLRLPLQCQEAGNSMGVWHVHRS